MRTGNCIEKLTNMKHIALWKKLLLSALSGMLLAAGMPGLDVPFLGWIALVPLLAVIMLSPPKDHFILALPFGLLFSWGVHSWYTDVFSPLLGFFLIVAVGAFYAGLIQLGGWLYARLPKEMSILAFPIAWTAIEFLRFIAPIADNWWFVLLAKSAWRFPPALHILSLTGFPGLSFLIMLANVAVASLLLRGLNVEGLNISKRASGSAIVLVVLVLIWGALSITPPHQQAQGKTFTIAALTDMVNQDPAILAASKLPAEDFGTAENSPEVSQKIFDLDARLTRSIADRHPNFVLWPENEFANADDPVWMKQLKDLASEMGSYIVADVVWHADTGMHDTALMVSPAGEEVGRRAKINITDGEKTAGFVPGPHTYPVFETPYGTVGLGVCWDRHRIDIIRALARHGADIVLMPVDDDFHANTHFPPFHASDGVFRAAENRVALGLGSTNGLSIVIDPYGRITAEGAINQRGVTLGQTFTTEGRTLYTRFGDWFGWLMVLGLAWLVIVAGRTREGGKAK